MSNKKQSSIEWLIDKITCVNDDGERVNSYHDWIDLTEFCNQAKAMHKDEIVEAYREGRSDQQSNEKFYHRNAESYFNETFGGE